MSLIGPETQVSHQYDLQPFSQIQTQYNAQTGAIIGGPTYIYSGPVIHAVNSRTGYKLENWKSIIRSGGNATTPLNGVKQTIQSKPCSCYAESFETGKSKINRYDSFGHNGQQVGFGNVSTFWADYFGTMATTADYLALKFLYGRLREDQTQFQGGIFLGELREALHMIRHPAQSLKKLTEDYFGVLHKRRREAVSLKRARKVLADSWLEYSFGWRPLMSDIADGITAYERLFEDLGFVRRTFSATGEVNGEEVLSEYPTAAGQVLLKAKRLYKTTVQVRYKCGTSRTAEGRRSTEGIANMLGVGWRDFAPTIWELVPWSFLVDYFVNVGEIINAATTITSDVTWVCKTQRKTRSAKTECAVDVARAKALGGQYFISIGGDGGSVEEKEVKIVRSSLPRLPLPSLRFTIPGSPLKWVNMAALANNIKSLTPYYKLRI